MLITLIVFLLILSVLVLVHELGHFIMAKKFNILVEEFGFGLPPRFIGKKIGETIYSINYLPIGGFVKLYGEDREEKEKKGKIPNDRAFYARPPWQRTVVIIAGVVMNFLLALIIISFMFTQGVLIPVKRVHIVNVDKESPAEIAGIKTNDIVHEVNGEKIQSTTSFIELTKNNLGKEITLTIMRGDSLKHYKNINLDCNKCQYLQVRVIPRKDPPYNELPDKDIPEEMNFLTQFKSSLRKILHIPEPEKIISREGPIGVAISDLETIVYTWYQAPIYGPIESLNLSWQLIKGIGITLWKLISFQSVAKDVAGPFGIAQITAEAVRYGGVRDVLMLLGLLSLNLAIINILPIPALDGGRLLFVVIEGITKKKIKTDWERYVHQIGMIILLLLLFLVTINDLIRFISS
ncbi:hypothetical protein A2W14_02200 [Candidatus Gottesmanbacteria bacterium RBG_16_37_8]|uniref:PDZ domain-containing protein n=1 Tax=Candidatus Gottesmanbacteria bacterium RBG_16_37_8 TaxID=1798371 RepID=A0A1F5YSF5_9BACT|nr:MAG: hypothetical protein A2W14_02200 [Candidatus Gottesmanbacteria bacterium RBG_16_37_8]